MFSTKGSSIAGDYGPKHGGGRPGNGGDGPGNGGDRPGNGGDRPGNGGDRPGGNRPGRPGKEIINSL